MTKPVGFALWARMTADLVAVLLFVGIGRSVHGHGDQLSGMVSTSWPFVGGLTAGWLLVLARRHTGASLRAGVLVCVMTVATGMTLRVVAGQGTAVAFVAVALCFLGATMLAWRAVTVVVARRRR